MRLTYNDFAYGKDKSDQQVGLYYLRQKNWYVIAIKGSSSAKEWLTDDPRIVVGENAFRTMYPEKLTRFLREQCPGITGTLTHAIEFFQKLEKQHFWGRDAKIHVTGHSLGGWVAIELAKKFKNKISGGHVFNAGSSPIRSLAIPSALSSIWAEFMEDRVSHGKFHHHHIIGDPLSQRFVKIGPNQTTKYKVTKLNFHAIANFSVQYDTNPLSLST